MNILLTGGAGYIGSHTAIALSEAGHDVLILDNFCNSHKCVFDGIAKILGNVSCRCVEADVRDTSMVLDVLRGYKIDAVMHFAGLKAVGDSINKPVEYYANNVQATISLLEAMRLTNIKTLVFSSSATVYGDPQYLPVDEKHPLSATNPYGRTKLHIEEILKDVAQSDAQWKIVCLRYFNPVGAHESGLIGEAPDGVPNNLTPYIAQVAVGRLPALKVYGCDYKTIDGTGVRDYIHVMDLAEAHLAAVNSLNQRQGWDAINIGAGSGYSVLQVLEAYRQASGKLIPHEISPRRAGDIASSYASCNKAKKVLGWSTQRTLAEMCASSWQWVSSNKSDQD